MPVISMVDIFLSLLKIMPVKLLSSDYEALAAFRYAMRKFLRFSKEELTARDLTPEQYEALLAIRAFGSKRGLTISDLSERLQVKHHTAINLVDKLAARNLIVRRHSTEDRRHVYVRLTRRGGDTLAFVAAIHRKEMKARSPEMIDALKRLQK
jgi:DNA-binding MarR family transcriptional regulator